MSNSNTFNPSSPPPAGNETESFADILSRHEKAHSHAQKAGENEAGRRQLQGTVVAVKEDSVFVDIGLKIEGVLPLSEFQNADEHVKPGDKLAVSVKGRGPDGYYELSRFKIAQPKDWPALERAFAEKATIAGRVIGTVKGGLSVDVGVRAFMPASRSGTRDAAELEALVEQEIRCRISELDVTSEDVVVDRRAVLEEEERAQRERRLAQVAVGETLRGTVRSLTDYGAFVDLGGVDGLLHVSDIAWGRINKPADVLTVGQEVDVRVLKVDAEQRRISLGLKQLEPHPWEKVPEKYRVGERVRGVVTRVVDFGAFVELEPGIEGLIHISELSWTRRVKKVSDVVKTGETVEAMILAVNLEERRISLGLKQAWGDPWADAAQRFAAGSVIEGPVTNITKFGAFVQLTEGIEGMVHVSDISAEKRINHPQDVLRVGQIVKAQVLAIDPEKRQARLGMKQLLPTSLEEYMAEHKQGDVVNGRVLDISGEQAQIELGEGIAAICRLEIGAANKKEEAKTASQADLSSLSSMLAARWKGMPTGAAGEAAAGPEPLQTGQVRKFRIARLDVAGKKIEVELTA